MSEHKKTITAISWCPDNPDLFASASADNLLIIWNVTEQKAVARLDNTKGRWIIYTRFYGHTGVFKVRLLQRSPLQQSITASPLLSQVSLRQSVGAGTQLMEWRLSPSVVRCMSGSMEVLTQGSQCIKKPTPSCLISVYSDGTLSRRVNWCLDTQTEVCLFFSQVQVSS